MAVVGSILFGFYAVVAGLLYLTFGGTMTVLAAVLGGSVLLIGAQYKIGKWGALRSVGAQDMPEDDPRFREIHRTVENLSDEMGIEKPRLMVADMGVPNAFAVGRKGAGVVVVSSQLIQLLEKDELDGVIAHELAHIKNRDVVMMVIGQGIATIVGLVAQFAIIFAGDNDIADFFLGIIVGNIVQFLVMLFVLAISRYREYVADSDAAEYTNNPDAMARALEKISSGAKQRQQASQSAAQRGGRGQKQDNGLPDEVAALCIFGGDRGILQTIFATHPPIEKRIEKLRAR